MRDSSSGDNQVATSGGQIEPLKDPFGGLLEFPEDGRDKWMFLYSFAKGLSLNPQISRMKESPKLLDIRPESGIRLLVRPVYPFPGEVFHEDAGYAQFLAQSKPERRNVAENQISFRFAQNVTGVFETLVIEGKEATEPRNSLS